jgi:hypothetical protein
MAPSARAVPAPGAALALASNINSQRANAHR